MKIFDEREEREALPLVDLSVAIVSGSRNRQTYTRMLLFFRRLIHASEQCIDLKVFIMEVVSK